MSSAIKTPAFQAKAGSIQNQADTSAVYSDGEWSFKNSTAVASVTIKDDGAVTLGPSGFTGNHLVNGKVGIGTDSPACQLEINNGTSVAEFRIGDTAGRDLVLRGGTASTELQIGSSDSRVVTFITNNTERMRMHNNGCLYSKSNTGISQGSFGTTGSNLWNDETKVSFKVENLNNCVSVIVGGTMNDRSANIQVGHNAATPDYSIYLGSLYLNRLGGTVYANTTAISDKRYKRDLEKVTNALNKVNQLSGYTYYRTDIEKDLKKAGVVAQEVEKVLPEAVVYNETDDMYGVSYDMLSALYIEAIKELTDKNKELEARLAALEAK